MNWALAFAIVASAGVALSGLVHVAAILGVDATVVVPALAGLHLGALLVWGAMLTAGWHARRRGLSLRALVARSSTWLRWVAPLVIVYAVVCFGLVQPALTDAHPARLDGQPALQADHGGPIRLVGEAIHRKQRARAMQLASLAWIIFYGLPAAFFAILVRLDRDTPVP